MSFEFDQFASADYQFEEYCNPLSRALVEIDKCLANSQRNLHLNRFDLDSLPAEISKLATLTTLRRLDLSHNNFTFLPPEIGLLTSLQELKLCLNLRIPFTLPDEVGQLSSLVNLKVSGNSLETLPETIANLSSLCILDVSSNNLRHLPENMSNLQKLGKLRADNNELVALPKNLAQTLGHLALSYNATITQAPDWFSSISYLANLTQLELRGCDIQAWPAQLSNMSSLLMLDLGDNALADIPEGSFANFGSLDKLLLDQNQLKELPEDIGRLTSLSCLNLRQNNIVELPLTFRFLVGLKQELYIDVDNFRMPPKEIARKGPGSIRDFMHGLTEGSTPCYRMKLVVVGQENVGKTSLLRRLRALKDQQPLKRTTTPLKKTQMSNSSLSNLHASVAPPISTDGIDIEAVTFSHTTPEGQKVGVEFATWDFAGQEIYYTTHQFFLSDRSIFLVVFDLRYDVQQHSRIEFWLESIKIRCGEKAPVVLVGTHADDKKYREEGALQTQLQDIANEFSARFPSIKLITAVSSLDGMGIEELKDGTVAEALKLKHMGEILPKPYLLLEEKVKEARKKKQKEMVPPVLEWSEFQELASLCHIHSEDTLVVATQFLHDLGVLLHFHDDESIRDIVVVDPQWLIDMMSEIITTKHNFCKRGTLRHRDLDQIWKPPAFPAEVHQRCLGLMRSFGISYEVEGDKDIIPCLLPEDKPEMGMLWLFYDKTRKQTSRIWQFEFIPLGLFSHLLIRLHTFCTIHKFWRNGVVVSSENDWALVEVAPVRRQIKVAVRTDADHAKLLVTVNEILQQLLDNWFRASVTQLVPCIHCIADQSYDPYLFAVEECELAILKGDLYVDCKRRPNAEVKVSLDALVPDISLKDFEKHKLFYDEIDREDKRLAEGAYGTLYRGKYQGETVAVKVLKTDEAMLSEKVAIMQEFRKEVSIMTELKHPNLVELKGYCFSEAVVAMVMEFMECGDLYSLIQKEETTYPVSTSLKLSFDIANGMSFLHALTPPILHRDLKPPNVLLSGVTAESSDGAVAKVCDFGLSTRQYLSTLKERAVETPMWVAPEILKGGQYTTKSDVYSYGIIVYEIFVRMPPFEELDFRFLNQLEELIIAGERPSLDGLREEQPEIADLIADCWHPEPESRPSFLDVLDRIMAITQKGFPDLHKRLSPAYEKTAACGRRGPIQGTNQSLVEVSGKFFKRLTLEQPDCVFALLLVGNEVWSAHRNGDLAIWSAENGKLQRTIQAAHSREIRAMALVGNRVWTGSRDGVIKIWKARSLDDSHIKDKDTVVQEGFLEAPDGQATYVALRNYDVVLGDTNVPLEGSRVAPAEVVSGAAFAITTAEGAPHIFLVRTVKERDNWVTAVALVINDLSEETQDLFVDQIQPRKRKDQINSILYVDPFVYVGSTDLVLRKYLCSTLECVSEHTVTENSWKRVSATPGHGEGKPEMPFKPALASRARAASVSFLGGGRRGKAGNTPPREPLSPSPPSRGSSPDMSEAIAQKDGLSLADVPKNMQFVWKLLHFDDAIWVAVSSLVFRLNVTSMRTRLKLVGHEGRVSDMVGVAGNIYTCADDSTVRCWDAKTGRCLKVMKTSTACSSLLAAGPRLWCGGREEIIVLDRTTGEEVICLKRRHTDKVCAMILVWNRIVWSGSLDKSICIWS